MTAWRSEWGWNPTYDLDTIVKSVVTALTQDPDRDS